MASHFSANQFEKAYSAKRLGNWELPKWYPPRPRQRCGPTKVIADDSGHLLANVKRVDNNPWGNFRGTYQLPEKITRRFGDEYNECLNKRGKWKQYQEKNICEDKNNNLLGVTGKALDCNTKCGVTEHLLSFDKERNRPLHPCEKEERKKFDLEYIPGDFTPGLQQHSSRQLLLDQKYERDNGLEPELPLDKLYLGDHDCELEKTDNSKPAFTTPLPKTAALTTALSPSLRELEEKLAERVQQESEPKMPYTITEKPNERCPSPIIPAYANFELAKRMHHDNLDHQPLPDCVADLAYRKQQINGPHPGLALDIDPIATGVGIKTHNVGPTHCTKMKVFRPKTCGVVPKGYYADSSYRPVASAEGTKKMGAMDLAIGWDYKPSNPLDEPRRPPHIDGSSDTAGPAVFTYVKTPRDDDGAANTGRSAGVFTNTLGESDFFDKDIMRRKTDFAGRGIAREDNCGCGVSAPARARSVSRDYLNECGGGGGGEMPSRYGKQYQSTPNILSDQAFKNLRKKYLGDSSGAAFLDVKEPSGCRRANGNFFRRARARLCHKVAPQPPTSCCQPRFEARSSCKAPFRVGVPKYNAAGHFISSDSGCSLDSNRVLVVPRPRNPYAKRNYDIDTLVPPFRCFGGGAGEGGYPEHWRLASVYQHAYKPMEQRRRPLLQTVYK